MKINHLFMVIWLFICCSSCMQDDSAPDIPPGVDEVDVTFDLVTMNMEEVNTSGMTDTRASDEVLDLSFGTALATRAANSLTPAQEAAIKTISYFEFNGTAGTSTCVKKGTATFNTTNNQISLTLTTSTTIRTVYIIANLGDITGSVGNNITLDNFQNLTYAFANDANVATTGLPMAGFANTTAGLNGGTVNLQRLVAKIRFICDINVPQGESFTFTSMRLVNASTLGAYVPKASYPPNNNAANFTSYAAVNSRDQVWYVPENRRGTVTNTDPKKKSALAPAYSTHVEITGVYVKGGVTYENTYRIYLGANPTNNFELLSNRIYQIQATIKGFDLLDSRIYVIENLSSNGTANCYIALRKNTGYKFNAKVMGNGRSTPLFTKTTVISNVSYTQNAPAITPATLSPMKVIVIWETGAVAGQVVNPNSLSLTADGFVRFDTADNDIEGNALIGVTDNANNILWSWHIWKTTYNPNILFDNYTNREGRQFIMMKHDLGAIVTESSLGPNAPNAGDTGLLYQWGRKDPFLGAVGWSGSNECIPNVTHVSHAWATGNDAIPNVGPSGSLFTNANASIAYAIKHPTHFILRGPVADWLLAPDYSFQRDNLWGNPNAGDPSNTVAGNKSINDPCPPGWRVPRDDSWTHFTTTGLHESTVDKFNVLPPFNKGWYFYISGLRTGPTSYYACQGLIDYSTGLLRTSGNEGVRWSSSTSMTGGGHVHFGSNYVRPVRGCSRSYGIVVRCAKE